MKPSTRVSLIGLGALALLSAVHWARAQHFDGPPLLLQLFGIWHETSPGASPAARRRRFLWVTLFAGVGLILWESGWGWVGEHSQWYVAKMTERASRVLVADGAPMASSALRGVRSKGKENMPRRLWRDTNHLLAGFPVRQAARRGEAVTAL